MEGWSRVSAFQLSCSASSHPPRRRPRSISRFVCENAMAALVTLGGFSSPARAMTDANAEIRRERQADRSIIIATTGVSACCFAIGAVTLARRSTSADENGDAQNAVDRAKRALDGRWRIRKAKFQSENAAAVSGEDESPTVAYLIPASSRLEEAIISTLEGAPISNLQEAATRAGLSREDAFLAFQNFGSAQVSRIADRVSRNVDSDDFTILASLNVLAAVLSRLEEISQHCYNTPPEITYSGTDLKPNDALNLYRRYVVFCFSTEQRLLEDYESLRTFRAAELNMEMSKAMYQVAVSSILHRGKLDDSNREEISRLRATFSRIMSEDVADKILSEVRVMRVLHELQKLLQEHTVTPQKLEKLQTMSHELEVNVEEVLESVNDLAVALGPESQQFVESLRSLLAGASDSKRK